MKLKPVFYLMASVACDFIVWMYSNKSITRLDIMLRDAINAVVSPGKPAIRSTLTIFLGRGYFEIAKTQSGENMTNLIQLLCRLGVRFLGIVEESATLPCSIQDKKHYRKKSHKQQGDYSILQYEDKSFLFLKGW